MALIKNRSLSFKLILLFVLTGVAMIILMRFASGGAFVRHFQETIRPHLQQYFQYISTDIGTPPDLETARHLSDSLKIKIIIKGPDVNWSSDGVFPEKLRFHDKFHENSDRHFQSGRLRRHMLIRINNPPYQTTFITRNETDLPSPWKLLFNAILGLLLVLSLLYFLLRRMISPLKDIQQSVRRIGSGELDHRIKIKQNDEFGELATEINAMADDVENMLEAKRQLLLAISHELRSPITRAGVAVSLMDDDKLREGLENDLKEMEAMISGLLEAEQLNQRHQVLNLSEVDVNALIKDVITRQFPEEPVKFEFDNAVTRFSLDEPRIQFVIKNLIGNALKYRKEPGDDISIHSGQSDKHWVLTVEDHGKGIPAHHIPHLTEPFYRVDPSRQRETGGYGLGLYIINKIIEAHKGELIIKSKETIGTKVTVKIPSRIQD